MRLTQIWNVKTPTVSFEFFPARTSDAAEKLERVIDQMYYLEPDFIGITFGAGGSTRDGSRQLVDKLINDKEMASPCLFCRLWAAP